MLSGSPATGNGKGADISGLQDIGSLSLKGESGFPVIGGGNQGVGSGFLVTGGDRRASKRIWED